MSDSLQNGGATIGRESRGAPAARILLVDDDRLVLSTLADELKAQGYEVIPACSGEESVRLARDHDPDLVLMDVRMPGMSGIEAARSIRETRGTPVLFLSAFDERDIVEQAVREGGFGYLVKPVGGNHLVPAIEAALARAADLRTLKASEQNLRKALAGERAVSVAIGLVMDRFGLNTEEAFERLRHYARSNQRRIDDVARALVEGAEFQAAVGRAPGRSVVSDD